MTPRDWTAIWYKCLRCERLFQYQDQLIQHKETSLCGVIHTFPRSRHNSVNSRDSNASRSTVRISSPLSEDTRLIDTNKCRKSPIISLNSAMFATTALCTNIFLDEEDAIDDPLALSSEELQSKHFTTFVPDPLGIGNESSFVEPTEHEHYFPVIRKATTPAEDAVIIYEDESSHHQEDISTGHGHNGNFQSKTDGDYRCRYCYMQCNSLKHLKSHQRLHIKKLEYIPCYFCPRKVFRSDNLVLHMRLHTKELPYFCEYCAHSFISVQALNLHNCNMSSFVHSDLSHNVMLESKISQTWSDSNSDIVCVNYKPNNGALSPPLPASSSQRAGLNCKVCMRSFAKPHCLNQHVAGRQHQLEMLKSKVMKVKVKLEPSSAISANHLNQVTCLICGKYFKNRNSLKTHSFLNHRNLEKVECTVCEKIFRTVFHFKKHAQSAKHIFKVNCQSKTSDQVPALAPQSVRKPRLDNKHPNRLLSCKLCDVHFSSLYDLNLHSISMHKGIRFSKAVTAVSGNLKNKCHLCSKVFLRERSLKSHLRSHTCQFQCSVCQHKFRDSYDLGKHMKIHTKNLKSCRNRKYNKQIHLQNQSGHIVEESNESMVVDSNIAPLFPSQNKSVPVDFNCRICVRSFANAKCLCQHLAGKLHKIEFLKSKVRKVKTRLEPNDFNESVCPDCGKMYKNKKSMQFHKYLKHSMRLKPHCLVCKRTFMVPANYRLHLLTEKHKNNVISQENSENMGQSSLVEQKIPENSENFGESSRLVKKKGRRPKTGVGTSSSLGLWKCTTCDKVFLRKQSLKRHVPIHTGEFSCSTCKIQCRDNYDLLRHFKSRSHHLITEGLSQEPVRKTPLSRPRKLTPKAKKPSQSIVAVSPVKLKQFDGPNIKILKIPPVLEETVTSPKPQLGKIRHAKWKCPICEKCYLKKCILKQHMPIHTDQFKCHVCGKRNRDTHDLKSHLRSHGVKMTKIGTANGSIITTKRKAKRARYIKVHLKSKVESSTEPENTANAEKALLKCFVCQKSFDSLIKLYAHKAMHNNNSNRSFKNKRKICRICNIPVVNLLRHYETQTHRLKTQCKPAPPVMTPPQSVNISSENRLQCKTCAKTFDSKSRLSGHMSMHNYNPMYASKYCDICDRKFNRPSKLRDHLLTKIHARKALLINTHNK